MCSVNSFRRNSGFEWLPPTSKWALQIPPLKWAYFLTACLPLCVAPRESSLHRNTHNEVWGGAGALSWNLVWFRSIDRIVLFSLLLPVWRYQRAIKYIGVCQYYRTWTKSLPLTGLQLEIKDWPIVLMEVKFFGLCFTYIFPHKTGAAVFGSYWKTECPPDLVRYRGGFISNALLCQLVRKLDVCGERLHFSW